MIKKYVLYLTYMLILSFIDARLIPDGWHFAFGYIAGCLGILLFFLLSADKYKVK